MEHNNQPRNKEIVTDAGGKGLKHKAHDLPTTIPQVPKIHKKTAKDFDVKSHVYKERKDDYPDKLEYKRNGKDQGLVIIFNQINFKQDDPRKGSTKDVNDVIFTLGRLGYNIDGKYIFSDLTSSEILEEMEKIEKEDLSDRNSLILFFLSHGDEKGELMTKCGTSLKTSDIWEKLGDHKDLKNKPKLFVFQACKGRSTSDAFDIKSNNDVQHPISCVFPSLDSLPKDVLLCYSAVEGMQSHRNEIKGTWFIQEICRNFMMYGRRDDIISLFTRVAKCVSTYTHENKRQMPVLVSTLSRKFYLTKSKDRTNKIVILKTYTDIETALKEMDSTMHNYERKRKI